MRKLLLISFTLLLIGLLSVSTGKLFGQTIYFDMDASASYVVTFPAPSSWDTSLTEKKRLYIIDADTNGDNVAVNWRTDGLSGRVRYGTVVFDRTAYEAWSEKNRFTHLSTFLKLIILE